MLNTIRLTPRVVSKRSVSTPSCVKVLSSRWFQNVVNMHPPYAAAERLAQFTRDDFDAEAFARASYGDAGEKGIRQASQRLRDLRQLVRLESQPTTPP